MVLHYCALQYLLFLGVNVLCTVWVGVVGGLRKTLRVRDETEGVGGGSDGLKYARH